MKKHTLEVPALYGDHHVLEIRRILTEIPGVQEVYASSSFQVVEVSFDESSTTEEEITNKLEEAGYLEELMVPVEIGAIQEDDRKPFFRHTEVYENTREVVSFSQKVVSTGRGLWPCPGMGPIKTMEE